MVNSRSLKKMKKEIAELKDIIGQNEEEIVRLKEQNKKLEEENQNMKKKMERIQLYIPEAKKILIKRAMPAELVNEMFAGLPLENVFGILAKMPNGLLARNVRKMLKSIEMAMKNNKWNVEDCTPNLIISENGLVVERSKPADKLSFVRAKLPIPLLNLKKPRITYFEVEILNMIPDRSLICIGFCTQKFPLEIRCLGIEENSIGIHCKGEMIIDGLPYHFGNCDYYKAGDVFGLGIIHSQANLPMKCFATYNGELLGIAELPAKYSTLQLFPAVNLYANSDSIRANFGQNEWLYYPERIPECGIMLTAPKSKNNN